MAHNSSMILSSACVSAGEVICETVQDFVKMFSLDIISILRYLCSAENV